MHKQWLDYNSLS